MRARASAAATVANLGPGYDALGLCLEGPRDVVEVELTGSGRVELVEVVGDGGALSREAAGNCATVAAEAVLRGVGTEAPRGGPRVGLRVWLRKGLPLGSGLGSSAASSVAGAVAAAAALGWDGPRQDLLDACREGERLATGTPHPDNVAPSLLGGLVVCVPRGGERVEIIRAATPAGLWVAAVKPAVTVRTADARAALPTTVPLGDAVANVAHAAGLVAALGRGDLGAAGRCLEDRLATPYRARNIPAYAAVVAAARGAGAAGAGISGSGPTVFALCAARAVAERAAAAMEAAFAAAGHASLRIVSAVDPAGARVEPGAKGDGVS